MTNLKLQAKKYFDTKAKEYDNLHYGERKTGGMWNRHNATLDILATAGLKNNARILDVGCGLGYLVFDLNRRGYEAIGLDVAPTMIALCKERARKARIQGVQFMIGDVEGTDFSDESFDAVIALGVIEYMESDEPMLQEMFRILKPGGILILNVTSHYGYSSSLVPISERIKRIPGVMPFATWLRRLATLTNAPASQLKFKPRRHRPSMFRRALLDQGFEVCSDRYFMFSLFPAPFSTLTSAFTNTLDEKLGCLDRTRLRGLGACYLVEARKPLDLSSE